MCVAFLLYFCYIFHFVTTIEQKLYQQALYETQKGVTCLYFHFYGGLESSLELKWQNNCNNIIIISYLFYFMQCNIISDVLKRGFVELIL